MLRVPGAQGFSFLAKDLPGFRLSGSQVCCGCGIVDVDQEEGELDFESQVQVIHEPAHFYEQLLNRSATARKVEHELNIIPRMTFFNFRELSFLRCTLELALKRLSWYPS